MLGKNALERERIYDEVKRATRHVGRQPANFHPNPNPARAVPVTPPNEEAAKVPPASLSEAGKSVTYKVKTGANSGPFKTSREEMLGNLRKQMAEAVKSEDFEQAARLRDKISELENTSA